VLVGMLMGRSAGSAALLDPLFSGTYAVPKLALFPDLHLRLRHRQPVEGGAGVPRVPLSRSSS
jgi:hypothetical protein